MGHVIDDKIGKRIGESVREEFGDGEVWIDAVVAISIVVVSLLLI